MLRMLSVCIAFMVATVLMPQGSVSAEAAKKAKSSSGKAAGPTVTGRFGLKTFSLDNPARPDGAGKKRGKKGN